MRAPKRIFWLELVTVGALKYRQKGGGKFTSLEAAEQRQFMLALQNIQSEIYVADCEWRKVVIDK